MDAPQTRQAVQRGAPVSAEAPISAACLVIIAEPPDGQEETDPFVPLFGISPLRRLVLGGERAGFGAIWVKSAAAARAAADIAGTAASLYRLDRPLAPGRYLIVSSRLICYAKWLRTAAALPLAPASAVIDDGAAALVDASAGATADRLAHALAADAVFAALARLPGVQRQAICPEERFILASAAARGAAEDWLLKHLVKESESFTSRHFDRRISLAITRRLSRTTITPNQITVFSVVLGLIPALMFASADHLYQVVGAVILIVHSIIDGCDGELARLKFRESRLGGLLDFWGDNVVHLALFTGITIGVARSTGGGWPYLAGASTVLGAALIALVVYRRTMRRQRTAGPMFISVVRSRTSLLARMLDAAGGRDFFFLILVLAAVDRLPWFLAITGIAMPIYLVLLLVATRSGRETAEPNR